MQDFWDEQHQGEQSSNEKMTQALAESFRLGNRWAGRGAHHYLLSLKANRNGVPSRLQAADFAHTGKARRTCGMVMGAANDQRYVEGVDHFFALPAFFAATDQVIGDAVVAAQNGGGDQAEQFFLLGAERAGFVGLVVESEEALNAEVAASEDFLVQVRAKLLKILPGDRPWFLSAKGPAVDDNDRARYYERFCEQRGNGARIIEPSFRERSPGHAGLFREGHQSILV